MWRVTCTVFNGESVFIHTVDGFETKASAVTFAADWRVEVKDLDTHHERDCCTVVHWG